MTQIDSIHTPLAKIILFRDDDGELWIKQNSLTQAMGYNKYLSLSHSRLGKFITNSGALKKLKFGAKPINVIGFKATVEGILPQFLRGFFGEIHGSSSREQFFDNKPAEIFHNTTRVLEILKQFTIGVEIMSYDANSPQARKGALGERIVKNFMTAAGWHVQRPDNADENSATHIDWLCTKDAVRLAVEVKTYKKFPYSFNQIPTFKIPLTWYENYKKEAARLGATHFEIWFVSSEDGVIYTPARSLDEKIRRDGYDFPVQISTKDGDIEICFHVDQFKKTLKINADDLAALRAIDSEILDKTQTVVDFDAESFWLELDYGSGLLYTDIFDDTLVALKKLADEFGIEETRRAIASFCADNYGVFQAVAAGDDYPTDYTLERLIAVLRDKLTPEKVPDKKPLSALLEQICAAVDVDKNDLAEAVLELRSLKFEREQARVKELLGVC